MATTTRPFGAVQNAGEETWRTVTDFTPKQLKRLKTLMKEHVGESKPAAKRGRTAARSSRTAARKSRAS
jgi:hypothetical protein